MEEKLFRSIKLYFGYEIHEGALIVELVIIKPFSLLLGQFHNVEVQSVKAVSPQLFL